VKGTNNPIKKNKKADKINKDKKKE